MSLKLPPIGLQIPPAWDASSEQAWLELRASAGKLADIAIAGRGVHADADRLRAPLLEGHEDDVIAMLTSTRIVRSLTWLWVETDGDCRSTVSSKLLKALAAFPLSRGAIHFLAHLYFDRFDQLDVEGESAIRGTVLGKLRGLLRTKVGELATRTDSLTGIVGALHKHADLLLDPDAPRLLAKRANDSELQYSAAIDHYGIEGFTDGRFGELIRQYLVLEELASVPMNAASSLLDEVKRPELNEASHRNGLLFGHAALSVMIARSGDEIPPAQWRQAVLAIAGDPRQSHLGSFRKWWSKLSDEHIQAVTRWIALDELELFLNALEEFADTSGNADMARMFPPRKRMLEGLLQQKRVVRSRLFLGSRARAAVRSQSAGLDIPLLSGGTFSERAIIYLDCGDFHIVEGSHNTKLWTYLLTPPPHLTDPRTRIYRYRDLTIGMAESFELQNGDRGRGKKKDLAHLGNWQFRFLSYLAKHRVYVDPETVLSAADYREFRRSNDYPDVAALAAALAQ